MTDVTVGDLERKEAEAKSLLRQGLDQGVPRNIIIRRVRDHTGENEQWLEAQMDHIERYKMAKKESLQRGARRII